MLYYIKTQSDQMLFISQEIHLEFPGKNNLI